MALAWDPLVPLIRTAPALPGSGLIILRAQDRFGAWKARVVIRALALVAALGLSLTVLHLVISGPPFILLG